MARSALEVRVVDVEDAVPVVERGIVATELLARRAGAAGEDVRAVLVARRDVELALQDVDEPRPLRRAS